MMIFHGKCRTGLITRETRLTAVLLGLFKTSDEKLIPRVDRIIKNLICRALTRFILFFRLILQVCSISMTEFCRVSLPTLFPVGFFKKFVLHAWDGINGDVVVRECDLSIISLHSIYSFFFY